MISLKENFFLAEMMSNSNEARSVRIETTENKTSDNNTPPMSSQLNEIFIQKEACQKGTQNYIFISTFRQNGLAL